jgi:NAD(P)-dependent dehydrogenase (short-subunit alcohol dehydrogenase family)
MARKARPLAIVTGASTGIGYELAKCCANAGFDLVIAADEVEIEAVSSDFERYFEAQSRPEPGPPPPPSQGPVVFDFAFAGALAVAIIVFAYFM